MNLSVSGIKNKLMKNADWVAFLASIYTRFDGDLGFIQDYFLKPEHMWAQLTGTLTDWETIKWKLLKADHLATGLFKGSLLAYLLVEIGIIPKNYKKTVEKVMMGSGIAAIITPGSGPQRGDRSSGPSGSWGNH